MARNPQVSKWLVYSLELQEISNKVYLDLPSNQLEFDEFDNGCSRAQEGKTKEDSQIQTTHVSCVLRTSDSMQEDIASLARLIK